MKSRIFDFIGKLHRFFWMKAYCPVYIRGFFTGSVDTMTDLHAWSSRHAFRNHGFWLSLGMRVCMTVIWPFRLVQMAWRASRNLGLTVEQQTGKNRLIQFGELLCYGVWHKLLPWEYYQYALYAPDNLNRIVDYLLVHEISALSSQLNGVDITPQTRNIVADKAVFFRFCTTHDLPTVPVLWFGNTETMLSNRILLPDPQCSVFIKPDRGARGERAMLWRYQHASAYKRQPDGETVAWEGLLHSLPPCPRDTGWVIQPCLENHSELAELSANALSSLRILTALRPDGGTEAIAATFRMPYRKEQIHSTDSLNSPVDMMTGELGCAFRIQPFCQGYEQHPLTKDVIKGRILPDWHQALDLVLKTHACLQGYVFLGWDVALTPDGPLLLEANAGWDMILMQSPQQMPLGQTRFSHIFRWWLDNDAA